MPCGSGTKNSIILPEGKLIFIYMLFSIFKVCFTRYQNFMFMKTLNQLFHESADRYAGNVLIMENTSGKYESSTYEEVRREVHEFGAGLISLGIRKGDRIALIAEGRKDWLVSELGILYAGAVNVPLSVKLTEEEIRFRLEHSGSCMLIVSAGQVWKTDKIRHSLSPVLKKIILLDPAEEYAKNEVYAGDVRKTGNEFLEKSPPEFRERWTSVRGNDTANICYTSGTTADPKGIMLTHGNYTANVQQCRSLMPVPEWYTTLLILPWDHSFAHTAGIYTIISAGASMASVQAGKSTMETLKNIPVNIKQVKPVFLLSVPALAKNFRKNIERGIREKGAMAVQLFGAGLRVAYRYNGNGWNRGKGFKMLLKPLVFLFDRILFSRVREGFGGKLRFFIGGGALLDIELQRFFYALGIPMFQGYGLTEAAPVISSNSEARHKLGSSGYIAGNLEVKICNEEGNEIPVGEKGEIVVKGENVMAGYWKNEKATAKTLRDGWLHTGDLGYLDRDGFLYVLGRFKSLLIADDGEKFSPEGIEEALIEHSSFIEQCMLYNNQNPYTVGLLVVNREALKKWAEQNRMDPSSIDGQKAMLEKILEEINRFRKGGEHEDMFPHRWLPAAVGVPEEGFTEENRLVNSTMKIVRGKITDKYASLIGYLYTPEARNIMHDENMKVMRKLFV